MTDIFFHDFLIRFGAGTTDSSQKHQVFRDERSKSGSISWMVNSGDLFCIRMALARPDAPAPQIMTSDLASVDMGYLEVGNIDARTSPL